MGPATVKMFDENQSKTIITRRSDTVSLVEDLIGGVFLLALAVVPVIEISLRKITGSGLVWSSVFLRHIVVWAAWMGGTVASREDAHLSLSSGRAAEGTFAKITDNAKNLMATAVNLAFALSSASFLVRGFAAGEKLGVLPIRLVLVILPLGYFSMSVRALWRPGKKPSLLLIPGILLGIVFAWPSVVNLIFDAFPDAPFSLYDIVESWYGVFVWLRWPLIILLLALGMRGLPIYIMLGGTALFLFSGNRGSLETLPNEAYNQLIGNMIPAIPLFTLTGFLLSENSFGPRLLRFFRAALGWLPGGLAIVAVGACACFTTFTGASGITILALGGLLASVLVDSGQYDKEFARGFITSSGSMGILFPLALPVIMYGVTAQISINDLYIGGLMPGLLLVFALSAMGVVRALKKGGERIPFNFKELLLATREAAGVLLLPVILMIVYFGGIANVVEMSALAVVYTLIYTAVNREWSLSLLLRVLRKGVPVIGGVLVILAMANGLKYYIVDAQVPTLLTAFFRDHVSSRFVFLILLNLALLVTGTLMDIYSAILVVAPLIVPLGELYGVHPVQLGVIFLANLQLGYLTPPVGMNLFLASYTFEEPIGRIYRQVAPFLLILLVTVLLITYVPWLSTAFLGQVSLG